MGHHYEGDDLIVRKIRVGDMENNTYVLECPATHEALLVDGCFEAEKILAASEGARVVGIVQTHSHYDHVEALPALKKKLGAPVYAHPAESYPVSVEVELSDGDTISVPVTRGRTPSSSLRSSTASRASSLHSPTTRASIPVTETTPPSELRGRTSRNGKNADGNHSVRPSKPGCGAVAPQ